jgi:cobalt-zinc-cadmium efflux system membrane fusion protein
MDHRPSTGVVAAIMRVISPAALVRASSDVWAGRSRVRFIAGLAGLVGLVGGCKLHAEASAAELSAGSPGEVLLSPEKVSALGIIVEAVAEQNVEDTLVTSGRVTFDDLKVAHVFSPVSGRVTEMYAKLGERVKKGQPLAAIQSPEIGQAVSDVHKAEANLAAADHDYKRQKDLEQQHAAATRDVEAAEDRFRQAKAELERAEANARLFRTGSLNSVTQTYTLASPIDGEVLTRSVTAGMEVSGQYSGGTAVELFTVGELNRVWALGDVYEVDVPRVKKDSPASIEVVAYKNKLFEGKVEWIQHVLDPVTRTAKVRFSFDNPGGALLPEMYGTVHIQVDERKALALPRGAIVRLGDTRVVFVMAGASPQDGRLRFQRRPVDVDDDADKWLPIKHGVDEGMQVVTKGAVLLSEM